MEAMSYYGYEWYNTHSWRVCVWLHGCAGQRGRGGGGGGGGMRSTAPYCQPAVAACEALLTVPSKSHLLTHTYSKMQSEGHLTHTHTLVQGKCEVLLFLFQEASALPRTSLVCLVFYFCLFFILSPPSQANALLLVSSLKDKRGMGVGGTRGEARRRGRDRGHVSEWEKNYPAPCGQTYTQTEIWSLSLMLKRQSRFNNQIPTKKLNNAFHWTCSCRKKTPFG